MTRHWFRKRDGRPRAAGTLFDDAVVMLEDRVMLDAVPTVTVVGAQGGTGTAATQNVLLKSPSGNFSQTFEFSNTSADNTVGFGPYIELIVPKVGTDGVATMHADDDGITFNNATYLGSAVNAVVNTTFDASGHATNTLTGDVVNGTPGNQFVVLQLPFGSYTPPQTPADIVVNFTLSDHADLGVGLAIQARAGFEYGNTATGNPATNHIVNPAFGTMDTITPTLMSVTKVDNAPNNEEAEVGTGPNQPLTYTINVDVAEGQTLTNIDITDLLPSSVHFLSATVTAGTGTITASPTVTAADIGVDTTGGHDTLTAHFNSVTGTASTSDAQITVSFYVAKTTFAGAPVIDPNSGATTFTDNQASATATWHPIDPLDPDTTFTVLSNVDTIENQPIVIQKTVAIVTDTGAVGLSPGDTVEYTLNVQVSDYFTIGNISLNDALSDGQRLDTGFAPTLTVVERGTTLVSGAMTGVTVGAAAPGDYTAGNEFAGNFASSFSATTGITTSTIDISAALAGHAGFLGAAGVISGGRVVSNASGTTLQLKFRAIVENNFDSDGLGASDRAVDQGDSINNNVVLSGSIRDNTNGTTTLNTTAAIDDASAGLTIAKGALTKSIYAINGNTTLPISNGQVQIKAGDTITYELTYSLPISSFENLNFTDFLPLPVLVAQGLTLTTPATPATAPGDGQFSYGPNDTYHALAGSTTPTEMFDAGGNSIKISYPNYSLQNYSPPNTTTTVDLLFTLTVQDTAFADGLFLTNLATSNESNTVGNALNTNGIVQVQLAQPNLLIQKAIVSATSGTITNPQSVTGLTFGPAGTATSFVDTNGPLTDARLGLTAPKDTKAAPNVDSNVTGLDGGDTARVALIVNNEGGNDAFDVRFGDVLPAGVVFAGTNGLASDVDTHLVVRRGDGTTLVAGVDYTITDTTVGGQPAFQITLANNYAAHNNAGIGKDGVTDGSDILVLTYDVTMASNVAITPTVLTSSASVNNFAALAGGTDISLTDPQDAATIGLAQPDVLKVLTATSAPDPVTSGFNLSIGETGTYTVTYTLPEGMLSAVRLSDLLPGSNATGRYEIVSATITSVGGNLFQADGVTALSAGSFGAAVLSNIHGASSSGTTYNDTATFGGAGGITVINNPNNVVNAGDQIVVTFVVRAPNDAENNNGDSGSNTGTITYGTANSFVNSFSPIAIAVPVLNLVKTLTTPTPINTTDTITFTIDVRHAAASGTDAFDLTFGDTLPTGLTNLHVTGISTNTTLTATTADFVTSDSDGDGLPDTVTFAAGRQGIFDLARGEFFTLTITANVSAAAQAGNTYTNTATTIYSTADNGNVIPMTDIAGERTGIIASGSAPVTIPVVLTKSLSDPLSVTSGNAVVGGSLTYFVTATLPEGASNNFKIIDLLPTGVTYDAGSTMLVSIGGKITTAAPTISTTMVGGRTQVTFSFGNVTDLADADAQTDDDRIVVQFGGTVAQTHARGDVIANTASESTDVTNGGVTSTVTGTSNTVNTTVIDPVVAISKQVMVSPGAYGPATTTAASGDTVQFRSIITAASGVGMNYADAQDVLFTDLLGDGATLSGGTVTIDNVSVAVGGTTVIGGVTVSVDPANGGAGFTIRFGTLAMGASHTIIYNAAISSAAGTTVGDDANLGRAVVTWDSISSTAGGVAQSGVGDGQNDHDQTANASATVGTVAFTKAFVATAPANGGATQTDTGTGGATDQVRAGVQDLAIGETVDLQFVVTVPAGARTLSISDLLSLTNADPTLAGRLTYDSVVSTTPSAGVALASSSVTTPDADHAAISFTTTAGSTAGTVTITLRTHVTNTAVNAGGDKLDLPATLTYSASPPAGVVGTLAASASVDLVEPVLTIDKQITTSDPTPNAGDTVSYTVVVTNTGNGPAYGVNISDPLPAGLTYSGAPSLTLSMGGGTSTPGSAASVTVPTLLPGQTATLTYSATIDSSAVTGVPINNTATIAASGSTPGGGGRAGPNPADSTSFTVEALQGLDKAISATSDPNTGTGAYRAGVPDIHIGETATVDLTVRLTEGTTGNVVLVDKLQLPGTLTLTAPPTIVTANGVTFTGTGTAGYTLTDTDGDGTPDTITMNFGSVTVPGNNDTTDNFFVVRYTTVVGDRPENQAGDHIDLGATLTTALGTAAAATQIDVVAPAVTLTKAAAAGFVSRGDTVNYSITLTNGGTSPAYDLSLADVLPAGLSYVPGTTTLTVGGVTTAFASPNTVTFAMLGSGQTGVVNYQVMVDPTVAAAASYTNAATISFDSLSGPGGRAATASGTATISTPTNVIALSKSIVSTTLPETGTAQFRPGVTDLNVGEQAVIDLTASFTEGTTGNVVITDQLPLTGKFQIVGTPTITFLGGTFATLTGAPVYTDTDGDGIADKVTYNFGTVTVPVDGNPTNNLIRIRYEVVTPDVASNVAGAALASPAMLTTASGNASASIFADIVAPNVTIAKAVATGTADAGDVKAYTVTIANTGTGPAFDLTLADTLPAGLTAVAGTTVLTVGGTSTTYASPNAVPIASLGVGQSAVLTFNAVIGDGVVAGSTLTNGATISYDSLPGAGGHPGTGAATASFSTAAVQTLDKSIVATSETFTGTQFVRPGVTDLTIGERATFELATTFSEGTTNNVVLTDQLITANGVLTFIGTPTLILGSGVTITGSVTPIFVDTNGDGFPDQVRFNLGTVTVPGDNDPANNGIRIRYDAVLSNVAANVQGSQLTLPATLSSTSGMLTASAPADIVAPVLMLAKTFAPDQPTDGQHTNFLLTIGHAGSSTAAATNIVLTEMLPQGALLAGVTVVGGPAGITISGGVITIPELDLGQTVVIRISTTLDFGNVPTGDTINHAGISYGTVSGTTPGGRIGTGASQAILPFGNPTTTLPGMLDLQEQDEIGSMGAWLDRRFVEDFPEIDPVYSGSAAPGTSITIDVDDNNGSISGLGTGIADAGGNWLIRLPSTTVDNRLDRSRFDHYYDSSRLFHSPNGDLFENRSLLGFRAFGDRLSVGSQPSFATQVVRINVGGQSDGFDASFAPAWRDQFFSMEPGLSTGGVFRDRAGEVVEHLFDSLASPEAAGLNRFNREFLTTADF